AETFHQFGVQAVPASGGVPVTRPGSIVASSASSVQAVYKRSVLHKFFALTAYQGLLSPPRLPHRATSFAAEPDVQEHRGPHAVRPPGLRPPQGGLAIG